MLEFVWGVTRKTIISLENGKYNAALQLAYRIARFFALGVSLAAVGVLRLICCFIIRNKT